MDTNNGTMPTVVPMFETLDQINERYADALLPFGIVLGIFAFIGIFGNALVIVVFASGPEYKNTNFKTFVIFLAVIDLFTCLTLIPADIAKFFTYFSIDSVLCKLKCFFNLFASTAASLILFVICVDRYRRVCQPLKKQIWPSLALKILLIVVFVSILLCSPSAVMCGINEVNKTNIYNTSTTVYYCSAANKYHDSVFRYVYKIFLTGLLFGLSIAFTVMYSMVGRIIIIHWRLRRQAGANNGVLTSFKSSKVKSITKSDKGDNGYLMPSKMTDREKMNSYKTYTHPYKFVRKFDTNKSSDSSSSKDNTGPQEGNNKIKKTDSMMCGHAIPRRASHNTVKIPYKTLIWLILTLVFLVTYLLNAFLSFLSTKHHMMSPYKLLVYCMFNRLYFVNNVINPMVYACLDKRFKSSCKSLLTLFKEKVRGMFTCWRSSEDDFH